MCEAHVFEQMRPFLLCHTLFTLASYLMGCCVMGRAVIMKRANGDGSILEYTDMNCLWVQYDWRRVWWLVDIPVYGN